MFIQYSLLSLLLYWRLSLIREGLCGHRYIRSHISALIAARHLAEIHTIQTIGPDRVSQPIGAFLPAQVYEKAVGGQDGSLYG
jgi:hypothetical protein